MMRLRGHAPGEQMRPVRKLHMGDRVRWADKTECVVVSTMRLTSGDVLVTFDAGREHLDSRVVQRDSTVRVLP